MNTMQPSQKTIGKVLMVTLVILNGVHGDIFQYPEPNSFLRLTCLGSACGVSKTAQALKCEMNGTCIVISWEQNDTCYLCGCPTEPLYAIPIDAYFGGTMLLWNPLRKLPGKSSLVYLPHVCKNELLFNIHLT